MLARYRPLIIIAAVVVLGGGFLSWLLGGGSDCSSEDAAKAKALTLSADIQSAAQQGKLKIEEVAAATRTINAAADSYIASHNRQAYCEALDAVRGKLNLDGTLGK